MSHPYSDDCTCPECTAEFNRVLFEALDANEEKKKLKVKKRKKGKTKKEVNIKSPTGVVHCGYLTYEADSPKDSNLYRTLCKHNDYRRWNGDNHWWPETDEPVTCKRCLRLLLLDKIDNRKYEIFILQGTKPLRVNTNTKNNIIKILVMQGFISDVLWTGGKKQTQLIIKIKGKK